MHGVKAYYPTLVREAVGGERERRRQRAEGGMGESQPERGVGLDRPRSNRKQLVKPRPRGCVW